MSDTVLGAGVAAVSAVIAAVVTGWAARRGAADANRVDAFEASVTGLEKLVAAQDVRITALERELSTVKAALLVEQQQHSGTRELLRIAMRHIRDMLAWVGGDRSSPPPRVPDELTHQL